MEYTDIKQNRIQSSAPLTLPAPTGGLGLPDSQQGGGKAVPEAPKLAPPLPLRGVAKPGLSRRCEQLAMPKLRKASEAPGGVEHTT